MDIRYTRQFLNRLEDIFAESEYILRYEKGNFKSGYCVLNESKIVILNTYFPLEGKINCLLEILKQVDIDPSQLSERNKKLFLELFQTELNI
jgi:hypothetical protein